ncbi:MAG TPA: ribokinase [Panacibacter sp.]|nr:ribokinase [Panacibacter sp.]
MSRILVIGSSNTDMVVKAKRFPQPGETILGGSFFMFPGGKGANQAVAAARLGGDVTFIFKAGNDIFGARAFDNFRKENINIVYAGIDEHTASGIAVITVNEHGENEIVVASGANEKLSDHDLNNANIAFEAADILLLQLEIPMHTVNHAVNKAAALNKKIILNPAPALAINNSTLSKLFLITPNETEAEILTGIKVQDEVTAAAAANALLGGGVQNVIITLGPKGAYFKNNAENFLATAPVVAAVDTTAAGDVFNGAIAVALAENKTWKDAIDFACKAAAISVTRMGAQSSAPNRDEL